MAGLGHGEAAGQLQGPDRAQVALVVVLGAEVVDRATQQPELHPELDQQRQVTVPQRRNPADAKSAFDSVEAPREVVYTEKGLPIAAWTITVCHGYHGFAKLSDGVKKF